MKDQINTENDDRAGSTWRASVDRFRTEADDWLTPADEPQLTVLYAIADELDRGTFQAALISQFSLVHRALLARRPGKTDTPKTETEQVLDMFENNPGVWRG